MQLHEVMNVMLQRKRAVAPIVYGSLLGCIQQSMLKLFFAQPLDCALELLNAFAQARNPFFDG
jgi:hypothetical protein